LERWIGRTGELEFGDDALQVAVERQRLLGHLDLGTCRSRPRLGIAMHDQGPQRLARLSVLLIDGLHAATDLGDRGNDQTDDERASENRDEALLAGIHALPALAKSIN